MKSDLAGLIRETPIMSEDRMKHVMYTIVKAVQELHSRGIVHRDLKPQNILVDENNGVYLADFGLATTIHARGGSIPIMETVGTPGYMGPEFLLADKSLNYTTAVDIWGIGCIFADLLGGTTDSPLFYGSTPLKLVNKILRVVGFPSRVDIEQMGIQVDDDEPIPDYPSTANTYDGLLRFLPNASEEALDFLRLCLQFNPINRLTTEELLEHPYLADLHTGASENTKNLIEIPLLAIKEVLEPSEYRARIYEAFGLIDPSPNDEENRSNAYMEGKVNVTESSHASTVHSVNTSSLLKSEGASYRRPSRRSYRKRTARQSKKRKAKDSGHGGRMYIYFQEKRKKSLFYLRNFHTRVSVRIRIAAASPPWN